MLTKRLIHMQTQGSSIGSDHIMVLGSEILKHAGLRNKKHLHMYKWYQEVFWFQEGKIKLFIGDKRGETATVSLVNYSTPLV